MINSTVFFLGLTSFFNDFSSEMIYPLLPIFLTTTLGAGPAFLGLLEGMTESLGSILKLFSGHFSDKMGHKKELTVAGYTLAAAARPFFVMITTVKAVFFIRFADRIGKGLRSAPRDALLSAAVPAHERGKAFGFQRSMDHAGALTGALAAYLLLRFAHLNLRTLFALAAIPGVIAVFVLIAGVKEKTTLSAPLTAPHTAFHGSLKTLFKESFPPSLRRFLIALLVFTLANSSDAFLLLRAKELGFEIATLPLLWVALNLVKSVFSTPAGIVSDRIGRKQVMITGWVLYALVYCGLAFTTTTHLFILLFCVYGLFSALTEGAEKALIADLSPQHLQGSAFGAYHFTIGLGALPASILCGILWQHWGAAVALGACSCFALIAAVILTTVTQSKTSL